MLNRKSLSEASFSKLLREDGYVVVQDVIDPSLVSSLRAELETAIESEREKYGASENYKDYGMLIACPIYGGSFLKLIENKIFMSPFDWVLGDTSIVYVYTSSSLPPQGKNYASRIHVDRPHYIENYLEALGCLVLLDDFKKENGATWVLPKSHNMISMPTETDFYKNAIQIEAPQGSVLYFNLRLWHAGGENRTATWRHAIGVGMVRGYMKQRIDLPRAMKNVDMSKVSDYGLQKLGFHSQPPTSLDEYYLPATLRSYKQRSEWDKK